jgi:hypothetical protein
MAAAVKFQYSVYGVWLYSDTALPELESLANAPDSELLPIQVRFKESGNGDSLAAHWFLRSTGCNGDDLALCGKIEGGYLLRFPRFADFIIDRTGSELRCSRVEAGTPPQLLRHLLLDRVLPLVLNLRGHDVLHATAVDTPAGVCAFIGPAGAGKSTLAASFAGAGYRTFCDDCLVIRLNQGIFCVRGYPGLRLWNDSFAALGNQPFQAADLTGYTSKFRVVSNCAQFRQDLRPLIAIYRVSRPAAEEPSLSSPRIERLRGREAFIALVSSAFVLDVTESSTLTRHFRFIEGLVTQVPVARLLLPNDFAQLPEARRTILNELERA